MAGQDPSPQTTLLILLGASSWPLSDLTGSTAFEHAARDLRVYFLSDPKGFHLPQSNVLDLFNSDDSNTDMLNRISDFLSDRIVRGKTSSAGVRDVFVYYIGHGGITTDSSTFYLAIRRTHQDYEKATSIAIDDLAERLKKGARYQRRILILDCCFAAQALRYFQGLVSTTLVAEKTDAAFKELDQGVGIPSRGTSFLASSGKDVRSVILPDETSTMFTSALLSVLHTGDPFLERERLTLHTVYRLTEDFLRRTHGDSFPHPELHSPDQSEGNIATTIAFFPNPRMNEIRTHRAEQEKRRRAEQVERTRRIEQELQTPNPSMPAPSAASVSPTQLTKPKPSPGAVAPTQLASSPAPGIPVQSLGACSSWIYQVPWNQIHDFFRKKRVAGWLCFITLILVIGLRTDFYIYPLDNNGLEGDYGTLALSVSVIGAVLVGLVFLLTKKRPLIDLIGGSVLAVFGSLVLLTFLSGIVAFCFEGPTAYANFSPYNQNCLPFQAPMLSYPAIIIFLSILMLSTGTYLFLRSVNVIGGVIFGILLILEIFLQRALLYSYSETGILNPEPWLPLHQILPSVLSLIWLPPVLLGSIAIIATLFKILRKSQHIPGNHSSGSKESRERATVLSPQNVSTSRDFWQAISLFSSRTWMIVWVCLLAASFVLAMVLGLFLTKGVGDYTSRLYFYASLGVPGIGLFVAGVGAAYFGLMAIITKGQSFHDILGGYAITFLSIGGIFWGYFCPAVDSTPNVYVLFLPLLSTMLQLVGSALILRKSRLIRAIPYGLILVVTGIVANIILYSNMERWPENYSNIIGGIIYLWVPSAVLGMLVIVVSLITRQYKKQNS